jgi:hypothetical protein
MFKNNVFLQQIKTMVRENMFEHYSRKARYFQKPKARPTDKQCHDCMMWANRKGIAKDFLGKHMKHNLMNFSG